MLSLDSGAGRSLVSLSPVWGHSGQVQTLATAGLLPGPGLIVRVTAASAGLVVMAGSEVAVIQVGG